MKSPVASGHQPTISGNPYLLIAAIIWLIVFSGFFYSLGLPNNRGIERLDVWLHLGDQAQNLLSELFRFDEAGYGWAYLPQRFPFWGIGLSIILASAGLGYSALKLVRRPSSVDQLEWGYLAIVIGISILSLLVLGLGLCGVMSTTFWRIVVVGLASLGVILAWSEKTNTTRVVQQNPDAAVPLEIMNLLVALLMAFPFLAAIALGGCSPETDFDVKEYHFGGPKEFFQSGRIQFLPHNVYTSFPFLTEMLVLLGMLVYGDWCWGALAGKSALSWFAPISAVGIWLIARRWYGTTSALWAAIIWLATPWTVRMSLIAYTEGGLSLFVTATTLAVTLMITCSKPAVSLPVTEEPSASKPISVSLIFAIITGFLAGSAMSCKYPGLLFVVAPAAIAVTWYAFQNSARSSSNRFLIPLVYLVGVALAVGPWLLKNLIETGNPVYPLAYSFFPSTAGDWNAAMNQKWVRGHSPPGYSLRALLLNIADILGNNDWHSPLLCSFAPLVLLRRDHRSQRIGTWGLVATFFWMFAVWWCFTHRLDRFWTPLIPIMAIMAGGGMEWSDHKVWRIAARLFLLAGFLFNAVISTTGLCGYSAYLGDLSNALNRTIEISSPELKLMNESWLSHKLPPNFKLLSVGDAEMFDARFPYIYNTVFDESIIETWCRRKTGESSDLDETATIRQRFADAGITHVYVNWQEIIRYRASYGYTDFVHPRLFEQLVDLKVLEKPLEWSRLSDEKPLGFADTRRMNDSEYDVLIRWAPGLIRQFGEFEIMTTSQLYPVRRDPPE